MVENTFFDHLMLAIEQKNGTSRKDICSHKPTTDCTWSRIIATKKLLDYGFDKSQIISRLNVSYNSVAKYETQYKYLFISNSAFHEIACLVDNELKNFKNK